ncbi:MAG: transposase, partial [Verrucomicrobiota bacterium]
VNQELKRRTRVASLFPNEASLLHLISALLSEISEEWWRAKDRDPDLQCNQCQIRKQGQRNAVEKSRASLTCQAA